VLAAIFQRSAAVILVARRADIRQRGGSAAAARSWIRREAMRSPRMLKREGIDYQTMLRVPHEGNPRDLLAGRADAISPTAPMSRSSLDSSARPYRTFAPAASGIDSTSDNLCVSKRK